MFTGIVIDIGRIEEFNELESCVRLRISSRHGIAPLEVGASIACSGICLTVVALSDSGSDECWFEVEAWEEAIRLTTLLTWSRGRYINLERSLRLGDELGGHLVSGHIDGTAEILSEKNEGEARRFSIGMPDSLLPFVARKGSVCLDGVSLTVNQVHGRVFDVLLIRHTLDITTWKERQPGDLVNIEIDQLARYAARITEYAEVMRR